MFRSDASYPWLPVGCEAHDRRARVLDWIESFDDAVSIIVTSRPAAIQGFREVLGSIGFAARRVMALTPAEAATLVRKFAQRSGLAELERALATEVARPDYASLVQVPVTLNLLLHVLAKEGVGHAVLSRSQLYDRAVRMMVQGDAFRGRLQGDEQDCWGLGTLRCMAFWNQFQGVRGTTRVR